MEAVKVFTRASYDRAFKKLTGPEKTAVNSAISRLPDSVGRPHAHSGIGLRRVGKYLECRAGLQLRVLFYLFEGDIFLATIGNHNDIARYVKEN